MTRTSKPIESFGPELLQALIEGARRRIDIAFTYAQAIHFRQRVNQLRHQMRLQDHPKYPAVSQARVTISWPPTTAVRRSSRGVAAPIDNKTPVILTIAPTDSEFASALSAVGITVPTLSSDDLPTTAPDFKAEDFFESLVKKTTP